MGKFLVVPQGVVDALAPRLSTVPNIGAQLAEQICRDDGSATLIQKMMAGEQLSTAERVQLPPLVRGATWTDVGNELKQRYSSEQPELPLARPASGTVTINEDA